MTMTTCPMTAPLTRQLLDLDPVSADTRHLETCAQCRSAMARIGDFDRSVRSAAGSLVTEQLVPATVLLAAHVRGADAAARRSGGQFAGGSMLFGALVATFVWVMLAALGGPRPTLPGAGGQVGAEPSGTPPGATGGGDWRLESCWADVPGNQLAEAFEVRHLADYLPRLLPWERARIQDGTADRRAFIARFNGAITITRPEKMPFRAQSAEFENLLCIIVAETDGSWSRAESPLLFSRPSNGP